MSLKVFSIALMCCAFFELATSLQPYHTASKHKQESRPYSFNYEVKDEHAGTDFGQEEHFNGKNVQGSYSLQLPDGRKQTVNYQADHHNGFQAEVSYYGKAQYPHRVPKPFTARPNHRASPSYQRPIPRYPKHQSSLHQQTPSYH